MTPLQAAIERRTREYRGAIDWLQEFAEAAGANASGHAQLLREAVELSHCLRRLVAERTPEEIHKAFGAPGDFGYETPIGDALSRLYRGEP